MINQTVDTAAEKLQGINPAAAAQLADGAPRVGVGMATTLAAATLAAPGMFGRVAPELQSREMSGMMRMASTLVMFQAMQNFLPVFAGGISGICGTIFGRFNQSGTIVSLGNTPLAASFAANFGNPNTIMRGMDAGSGATTAFGAQSVSVQSAPALQQNTLAAVPGLSGPSLTPGGRG